MEMIMARAKIDEDDDRKMARFMGGLNLGISSELELYEYHTMEELVQKAMKIERRMKARSLAKPNASKANNVASSYKFNSANPSKDFKGTFSKNPPSSSSSSSFSSSSSTPSKSFDKSISGDVRSLPKTTPTREIKCFK